jgi:hypothetical protein
MASPYTPNVAISSASSLLLTESPTLASALIAPSNGLPNSRLSIGLGSSLAVPVTPPPVVNSPTPASPVADWLNGPTNSEAFVWPIGNSAPSAMEQLIGPAPIGPQLTLDQIIGSSAPIGPELTLDQIIALAPNQPSPPVDLATNDQTAQMIEAITGPQIPDADRASTLIADTIDYPPAEGTSQLSPELLAVINGMAPEPIAQPSPQIQSPLLAEEVVDVIPLPNATLGSQGTLLPPPELLNPDFQPAPMPVLTEAPISSLLVTTSFPEADSGLAGLDLAGLPIGVVPGTEELALDGQLGF